MDPSSIGFSCVKSEFQWKNLWLSHDHADRFAVSQFGPRYQKVYMVYRLVMTIWWGFVLTYGIRLHALLDATWLAYATHWSLSLICISSLLQLGFCVLHMVKCHLSYQLDHNQDNKTSAKDIGTTHTETGFCETDCTNTTSINSNEDFIGEEYRDVNLCGDSAQKSGFRQDVELILCKIQWAVYNMSCNSAFGITAFYWIYFNTGIHFNQFLVYSMHIVNTVYVVLDVMISAIPIRILHTWYTMLCLTAYFTFTAIYEYCGGPAPYRDLNWLTDPASAAKVMAVGMFSTLIFQLMLYALYLMRLTLYYLFCKNTESYYPI